MEGEGANKKRGNARQLTQDDEVDDEVGEGEESKEFQMASQEQLSQRRFVSTRKSRTKNTVEESKPNPTVDKPKFDFNFPSSNTTAEIKPINFDNPPKLEFNFDTSQKPTFDFNFPSDPNANTTSGFNFQWNPTENPFATNSAFLETKNTFESSDKLFNNTVQSNTFGKIAQTQEKDGLNFSNNEEKDQEEETTDNPEPTQVITPIVNLKEEQQKTGEEDEEKLFAERAKLFILLGEGDKKAWKERGVGKLTINRSKEGSSRFVFRTDQTRMVRLNALIYKGMISKVLAEKGVTFIVMDSSENEKASLQSFFVRFSNKDLAQKLLSVLQDIEKAHSGAVKTEKKIAPTTQSITINTPSKSEEKTQPVASTKQVTQHALSTFVEGNFRGIITFVQNSNKKKTLIEGTFKGAAPNSKFSLNLDNKTVTSFSSDSSGDITFATNKVLNLIGSGSSLGSNIIIQQDGTFNSFTTQIKKDDEN